MHQRSREEEPARPRAPRRTPDTVKQSGPPAQPLLGYQQTIGNRAVAQMVRSGSAPVVQRGIGSFFKKLFGKKKPKPTEEESAWPEPGRVETRSEQPPVEQTPKVTPEVASPEVVTISGEKVLVNGTGEREEATDIIRVLTEEYGITLSWSTTRDAIIDDYAQVDESAHAGLMQGVWQMKELRALQAATAHFSPILGPSRATSSQKDRAQGVTTIGRLNDTFSEDSPTAEVERGTMGEYFESGKSVGLFDTVTDLADPRYVREGEATPDNATTLEANSIHEMSHGLIEPYARPQWVSGLDFWTDAYTPSGEVDAEEPPTGYGHTSAGEDLAESFAIFFTNRPRLLAVAPEREALCASIVAAWTPPVIKKVLVGATNATGTGD